MTFQESTKEVLQDCKGEHFLGGNKWEIYGRGGICTGPQTFDRVVRGPPGGRSQWAKVFTTGVESLGTDAVTRGIFCRKIKTADKYIASFVLNVY